VRGHGHVAGLWAGALPAIDNLDALNELLRVDKRAIVGISKVRCITGANFIVTDEVGGWRTV
jgi:hypothetical protein